MHNAFDNIEVERVRAGEEQGAIGAGAVEGITRCSVRWEGSRRYRTTTKQIENGS